MMTIRHAQQRGHADHGWLNSYHTFSFADYYDPAHMGFGSLRVINEDRVAEGGGFPKHAHRDMEIISYVLEGGLAHSDSMGTGSQIFPGDVQRMSAGTGVTHSEFNASTSESVHFLQIWLIPARTGMQPSYAQKSFSREEKQGRLRVILSHDARDESLRIHSDAVIYAGNFEAREADELELSPGRRAWVQVARGKVRVNGTDLEAGDGAAISDEAKVCIAGVEGGEVLVFDLA